MTITVFQMPEHSLHVAVACGVFPMTVTGQGLVKIASLRPISRVHTFSVI